MWSEDCCHLDSDVYPYLDLDCTRFEGPILQVQDVRVVLDNDWHNGHASLDGKVEGALLER